MRIVLATTSPYRIEAMELTGIPFEAKGSNVEEYFEGRPNDPEELVKHLSKLKAEAVATHYIDALVLGFDSVCYFNEKILEKPKSYEETFERLKSFSGNKHSFYTGITLINTEKEKTYQEVVSTEVMFRNITEAEIKKYLEEDPKYNTYALGYDPFIHSSSEFIKQITGNPVNFLIGTPISRVKDLIEKVMKED